MPPRRRIVGEKDVPHLPTKSRREIWGTQFRRETASVGRWGLAAEPEGERDPDDGDHYLEAGESLGCCAGGLMDMRKEQETYA
jgi:hypothetical protein